MNKQNPLLQGQFIGRTPAVADFQLFIPAVREQAKRKPSEQGVMRAAAKQGDVCELQTCSSGRLRNGRGASGLKPLPANVAYGDKQRYSGSS